MTAASGNFSDYQRKKLEMLEIEAVQNQKFDKALAQEEIWIRKGIQARCTRNEGRVRRLEALRLERASRRERSGNVNLNVDDGAKSGRMVAELEHVSKSYGDNEIIKDFSCRIMRGDRVGLLGPNGAGKSTLLRSWLEQLPRNETAVIVNEQGEVGVDGELLAARVARLREITGGCVCCRSQAELSSALLELGTTPPRPSRLFVETSGAASPAGVILRGSSFGLDA